MQQKADMVIMYDFRGYVEMRDAHSVERTEPRIDPRQDVEILKLNYTQNRLKIVLRRPLKNSDPNVINF